MTTKRDRELREALLAGYETGFREGMECVVWMTEQASRTSYPYPEEIDAITKFGRAVKNKIDDVVVMAMKRR